MAEVKIMVGGRQYAVTCRDGDEPRLHQLAEMMSERVQQVSKGSSGLTEVRQLLFAGLLLADSLSEKTAAAAQARTVEVTAPPPATEPDIEPALLAAIGEITERIEALGDSLAAQVSNA